MTALVPRPRGYDLRFLNASEASSQAHVRLQPQPAAVTPINLGGDSGVPLLGSDGVFSLPVRPWEIVTLRVTR
jgi:hypothetical protein